MTSTRRARRGFTLIEVMVALVVTGLVAGVAFGAAQAGIDVKGRLDRVRREETSAAALREVLHDALRHTEPGADAADTTFAIAPDGGTGEPLLRIVTRGVLPPLGTGGRWAVSLVETRDGLTLLAVPMRGDGAAIRLVAPAVAGAAVRVLDGQEWRARWDRPSSPPPVVAVRFLDATGNDLLPALVARTRPAGVTEDAP